MRPYSALGQNRFYFAPEWVESTSYRRNDIVAYRGDVFLCISDKEISAVDPTDDTKWLRIVDGLRYRGAYSASEAYDYGDVVASGTGIYVKHSGLDVGPAMELDFVEQRLSHLPTVSRASTAAYFDPFGVMRFAAENAMRLDHDPVTGECLGLLIEEGRTNLIVYSEDLADVSWLTSATVVTSDDRAAPDAQITADKLEENTDEAEHGIQAAAVTYDDATTYTFSAFVRAAERENLRVLLPAAAFGDNQIVRFDLGGGTATVLGGTPTATIRNIGGEWYRITLTATTAIPQVDGEPAITSVSATGVQLRLMLSDGAVTYTGTVGSGLHIWGAQLEVGEEATSYIPTTSAARARPADTISLPLAGWYSATGGTFAVEARSDVTLSAGRFGGVFSISDGTSSNRLVSFINPSNSLGFYVTASGSEVASLATTYTPGVFFNQVLAYAADDYAQVVGDGSLQTDTTGVVPSVLSMRFGTSVTNPIGITRIRKLTYWALRHSNDLLSDFAVGGPRDPYEWNRLSANSNYRGEWKPTTHYNVNDVVLYGERFYKASQINNSHPKSAYWRPFVEKVSADAVWNPVVPYATGNIVAFESDLFSAVTANTENVPSSASWVTITDAINDRKRWSSGSYYAVDDVVDKDGVSYRSLVIQASKNFERELDEVRWERFNDGLRYRGIFLRNELYAAGDVVRIADGRTLVFHTTGRALDLTDASEIAAIFGVTRETNRWFTAFADRDVVSGDKVLADTTIASFTLRLPSTPEFGDTVEIVDKAGTFSTNNLIVDGNGSRIAGDNNSLICDITRASIRLSYVDRYSGWIVG